MRLILILLATLIAMMLWWHLSHAEPPLVITPQWTPTPRPAQVPPFPIQLPMLHYRCEKRPGGAVMLEPIESTVPNRDTAVPVMIFNCVNCECGTEK